MLTKQRETRWLVGTLIFMVIYGAYLLLLRGMLSNLEGRAGELLKPEHGQIIAVVFLILLYHLAFVGISAFSLLGPEQKVAAFLMAVVIHAGLLYAFKLWYDGIVGGLMLFTGDQSALPWYAREKVKFFVANGPLILYFIVVFTSRLVNMGKVTPACR